MKRFHVHVSVRDLPRACVFLQRLFGARQPSRSPRLRQVDAGRSRINFRHSQRGHAAGVNHLGFRWNPTTSLKDLASKFRTPARWRSQAGTCALCESRKVLDRGSQGVLGNVHTLGSVPFMAGSKRGRGKERVCVPTKEDGSRRDLLQLKHDR